MSLYKFEKEARRLFQERRQNLNLQEMLVSALNYQRTQYKLNVRLMKRPQDKESLVELEIVKFVPQERGVTRREECGRSNPHYHTMEDMLFGQRADKYMDYGIGVVVALTEEQRGMQSFQRIQYRGLPYVNFILTDLNSLDVNVADAVEAADEQDPSKSSARHTRSMYMEFDTYVWIKIVEAILFVQNLHVPEGTKLPVYYANAYDDYGFLRPVELVERLKPSIVVEGGLMNAIVRQLGGFSYDYGYANLADLTDPEEMAKNLYLVSELNRGHGPGQPRVEYTEDFIKTFNLSTQN